MAQLIFKNVSIYRYLPIKIKVKSKFLKSVVQNLRNLRATVERITTAIKLHLTRPTTQLEYFGVILTHGVKDAEIKILETSIRLQLKIDVSVHFF